MVGCMHIEEQRVGRLLDAQARAVALFEEVAARRGFGGFYEQLLDLG